MQDKRLVRMDAARLTPRVEWPFPVRIFANDQVAIEPVAVDELFSVLESQGSLGLEQVAITPDFHKGAGVPIGTVLQTRGVLFPQAVGNDINCGMRLHTTNLAAEDVTPSLTAIEQKARHLFFEGGRQLPMTREDREALLCQGLQGLFAQKPWEHLHGQWSMLPRLQWQHQLSQIEALGSFVSASTNGFTGWLRDDGNRATYDDQIGSIGGGNHFVEFQCVAEIHDRQLAYAWGLEKGAVTIMIHSGSVGLGHIAGRSILDLLKSIYPTSVSHPRNGIYPLAADSPAASTFWSLFHGAANFAFANRLALALSAVQSIENSLGPIKAPLLYDAPHNLVWAQPDGTFLHRKGATPARGPSNLLPWGEPVLVPGSMGASSFVLAGLGSAEALNSASHGAGRALSRSQASRTSHRDFERFLQEFRIVTPLDYNSAQMRRRPEILKRKLEELQAEGPQAYKGIRAVIDTLAAAGIAKPVAELKPLMTIKG